MTGAYEDSEDLGKISLESLSINTQLRRQLMRAGFKTLAEVFALNDAELDEHIGPDATDQILHLAGSYKRNPAAFVKRYLKRVTENCEVAETHGVLRDSDSVIASVGRGAGPSRGGNHRRVYERPSGQLPACKEAEALRCFEKKASKVLGVVADHAEDAFIAEALGMVSTDIPDLRRNVKRVFDVARKSSSSDSSITAVRGLANEVPDAFLLYMLDSAQRNFTGNSVWRASFEELGITDHSSKQEIPRFLYERIEYKGFKTYAEGETKYLYFYTILLHAGLAESDWISIWSRLIIPLVKDIQRGKLPDGSYPTAVDLIKMANDKFSGYYLANRSAQNLIAKVPEVTGPLLASALSVAESALASMTGGDEPIMMSSGALSPLAMDALKTVLASEDSDDRASARSSRMVYFPHAELRLSLADEEEPIWIHWESTRFPQRFAGSTVSYRVNGIEFMNVEILSGVGSAILEEVNVKLAPARAYDIEVELSGEGDSFRGKMFSTQSFRANRPGVYEFVRASDGVLRQKTRPLHRKREVCCLVAPGFRIVPKAGMHLVNREKICGVYSVETYKMDQMGCGEVLDSDGSQVSAWCEGFRVTVDRSQVIGEGRGGADLYPLFGQGAEDSAASYNDALPSVLIEGMTEGFGCRQLRIELLCDGRVVSVKRKDVSQPGDHGGKLVLLRLDQSNVPAYVNDGRLRVTHLETGRLILGYRFSVVPIRCVSLEDARIDDNGVVMATYAIAVKRDCRLCRNAWAAESSKKNAMHVEVPLSDEWLSVSVSPLGNTSDPEVDAHIFLAGINVDGPRATRESFASVPDRNDLQEMSSECGVVTIECHGRRASRGAYLSLGHMPCFYKMLPVASRYRVNPFDPLPSVDSSGDDGSTELTLSLSYECGDRDPRHHAVCELSLGSVMLGYGFGSCSLKTGVKGCAIVLSKAVDYDLVARFSRLRNGRETVVCGDVAVPAGASEFVLPREAEEVLLKRGVLRVTFATEDFFGDPDFSVGQHVDIRR